MTRALIVPEEYSPHLTSLLKAFLANASPKDAERMLMNFFAGAGGISLRCQEVGSWQEKLAISQLRRPHRRNVVDDGFFSEMAIGARMVSVLQIPEINPVDPTIIPNRAIPFSKLDRAERGDVCVFHEKDPMFADYLVYREMRDIAHEKVSLFASADCSLYVDMPLCLQIANIYMNRLTAHDLQRRGKLHAPLCRWGDERTYKPLLTEVPLAFIGLPKNSALWIGTYGVSKKKDDKIRFREGLEAMLEWLSPVRVFVYGSMPKSIFGDLCTSELFVKYPEWISLAHGRCK